MKNRISFVKRDESKLFLSLEEAADLLGISSKTLSKRAAEGVVPARNVGEPGGERRYWLFSRSALVAWLAGGDDANV